MGMENRYDKYKDSGIAWIGEIPEHWTLKRIKNICDNLDYLREPISAEHRSKNNPIYDYYGASGVIDKIDYYNVNDQVLLVGEDGANLVMRNLPLVYKAKGKFWVNNHAHILKPKNNNYDFCAYTFEAADYSLFITGSAQPKLSQENLGKIKIAVPSFLEQQSIATYLDQKCGEIDELITLQEEMITKLQSYKQSVITEAVTKGLDKNVPLKDSGIEWIGEIPEHWNIIKTKNAFKIISGATPKTDNMTYWDGEITWITPADYKTEDRVIKSGKRNITLAGLNSCGTSIVPENSIIFSKRAPIGLVAINVVPLCTNQGCISCIPKLFVSSKYFYYLMGVLTEWFELFGSGTTFKELSTNNFANFSLSQPPLSEQQSIANYLDQKCSEIDELISIKQQKIEKLKDYKKSLIFECVTGKRKV